MTKAQYEEKLGPLLNDVIDPALRATLGTGAGIASPRKVSAAIGSVRLAHDQMAGIRPPAQVADLHKRAVAVQGSMIRDMTKLRDAEISRDRNGQLSAAAALKNDARHLVNLGRQFTSRGY